MNTVGGDVYYGEEGGVPVKYRIEQELHGSFSVGELCRELGISRSGFYAYRQIHLFLLREHNTLINHKKVIRLMQEMGIRSRIRLKRWQVAESTLEDRVADNLLQRNFTAEKPEQKWVTDVTQYRFDETWLYLSVIKRHKGELKITFCFTTKIVRRKN